MTRIKYDVFITHALEDQQEVVKPLAEKLHEAGLRVWYSGRDMRLGQPLNEVILNKIIPASRFGVVIMSRYYFQSEWGRKELNALHAMEGMRSEPIILPIWHNVDESQIKVQLPYLEDRFAIKWEKGLDVIVERIIHEVASSKKVIKQVKATSSNRRVWGVVALLTALVFLGLFAYQFVGNLYDKHMANSAIAVFLNKRIKAFDSKVEKNNDQHNYTRESYLSNLNEVYALKLNLTEGTGKCARHYFSYTGPNGSVSGKRKVEEASGYTTEGFFSAFGISNPVVYLNHNDDSTGWGFLFINTDKVSFDVVQQTKVSDHELLVKVEYENSLRCVVGTLECKDDGNCRKQHIHFWGLPAQEEFSFTKKGEQWECTDKK